MIVILLALPKKTHIEALQPVPEDVLLIGKEHYVPVIKSFSHSYGVSYSTMERIIDCENREYDPRLQSRIKYNREQIARYPHWGNVGDYERSYGLVQIHIPSGNKWKGKTITKEQAQDPYFSIEFLAERLSRGKGRLWSCY